MDLCWQSDGLLFNMLSRFVIGFLPRSKRLLILWLQSLSVVIMESKKMKSDAVPTFSPPICHQVVGSDAMIFVFWLLTFKPGFSLFPFTFIKRLFSFCFPPYVEKHMVECFALKGVRQGLRIYRKREKKSSRFHVLRDISSQCRVPKNSKEI